MIESTKKKYKLDLYSRMIELYLAVLLFGVGSYINMNKPISKDSKSTTVPKKVNMKKNNKPRENFTMLSPSPYHSVTKTPDMSVPVNVIAKEEKMVTRKEIEHKMCEREVVSSLTGKSVNKQDFLTNSDGFKMTPYFCGSLKQNTGDISRTRLANHTGRDDMKIKRKREIAPMFKPTPELTNVHGMTNWTHKVKDRYLESNNRTNELPFEQFIVGPGLGKEGCIEGQGGFHDFNINEVVRNSIPTIDDLRVGNQKQTTHTPPTVSGKLYTDKRGIHGKVSKNRTEKEMDITAYRDMGGMARVNGQKVNDNFVVRDKNKKLSRPHYGNAAPIERVKPRKIATTQKSRRNLLRNTGLRNVGFGELKTVASFLDKAKQTKKETMVGNSRPEGNMDVSIPSKMTAYDPNDIARTTKKEQLIDNKYLPLVSTYAKKIKIYDYDTKPKITIRNTTPSINPNRNLDGHDKPTNYLTDEAKTTVKEQTEDNKYKSNAHYAKNDGYMTNPAEAPYTNKQFLSDHYYSGGANSRESSHTLYMSAYNASLNTNKERIARGRKPMGSNVKLASGGDTIKILHKKQSHGLDTSRKVDTHVFSKPPTHTSNTMTKQRVILSNKEIRDRIQPDILDAFNNNPYSQPLNSSTPMSCNKENGKLNIVKTNISDSQRHIGIEACCEESVLLNNTTNNIKCNYKGSDASKSCNAQQIVRGC